MTTLAAMDSTSATSYRRDIAACRDAGMRFAGTNVAADVSRIRTLLVAADGTARLVSVTIRNGGVPSIVDLYPAASWDEREAHDLFGIGFTHHEPLRPLVDHILDLDRWTVPVRGDGPSSLPETGCFRRAESRDHPSRQTGSTPWPTGKGAIRNRRASDVFVARAAESCRRS